MRDAAEALLALWRNAADKFLLDGRFAAARAQKHARGISFNITIITPGYDHELRDWDARFSDLLANYEFDVSIEHGVPAANLDEADLIVVFPLSDDLRVFCVEFAKEPSRASRMLLCIPEGDDGKSYCRYARETYKVATINLPVTKLVRAEECRFGIDLVCLCGDYLMNKVKATVDRLRIENTVVILVHGIRTRAMWQTEIQNALEGSGLVAIPTNYNKFDVIRFLFGSEKQKLVPLRRVEADIDAARKRFQGGQICILAHSFGTYLTGRLLASRAHAFDKIVLCGSVLRSEFDFGAADTYFQGIINEIGCRDIWPAFAAKFSSDYGPTGSFGFNRGSFVVDRKHNLHGHSHFLTREFCERFWVPYFRDGLRNEIGDVEARPSWLVQFVDSFWCTILLWVGGAALFSLAVLIVGVIAWYPIKWIHSLALEVLQLLLT